MSEISKDIENINIRLENEKIMNDWIEKNGIQTIKTEKEWEKYKKDNYITNDDKKKIYMEYGSIYGKRLSIDILKNKYKN